MATVVMEALEVHFPAQLDPEPALVIFGQMSDGQLVLVDSICIGPFPDWEQIARRVMRHTIRCARGKKE